MIRLFLIFALSLNLYAKNSISLNTITNESFILPRESKIVKDKIDYLIKNSKISITIAMYNFSYKKFAKELIKASKKGVEVTIVLDKKNKKENQKIYKLLQKSNIKLKIVDKKMHLKVAIFDKSKLLLGSANWTKKSFKENYEILFLSNDKKNIDKISNFILSL